MHKANNQTTTRLILSRLHHHHYHHAIHNNHHHHLTSQLVSNSLRSFISSSFSHFSACDNFSADNTTTVVDHHRINICGKSRQDLLQLLRSTHDPAFSESAMPDYRINQLFQYMYHRGETDFMQMTLLSKAMKHALNERFKIEYCSELLEQKVDSKDGTRKLLLAFDDDAGDRILSARQKCQTSSLRDSTVNNSSTAILANEPISNEQKQELKQRQQTPQLQNNGGASARTTKRRVQVESVYIPEEHRGTVCVSSQVGCSMSCKFCHTGTQALERNLSSEEIVRQVMMAKRVLNDFNYKTTENRQVSHVVMMGQGEPLYNYRNVKRAIETLSDDFGLNIGQRAITVSTCGVVPVIPRLNKDFPRVHIAISLHATTDELRNELVPINKTYNIATLMDTLRQLPHIRHSRKLMFEYVMLRGVNDSFADADRLVKLLDGLPAIVNLIPFNSWPGSAFVSSSPEHITQFSDYIASRGIRAPIRWSKGAEIYGACGQLKSSSKLKQAYIKLITAERQTANDEKQ